MNHFYSKKRLVITLSFLTVLNCACLAESASNTHTDGRNHLTCQTDEFFVRNALTLIPIEKEHIELVPFNFQKEALDLLGNSKLKKIDNDSKYDFGMSEATEAPYLVSICLFFDGNKWENAADFENWVGDQFIDWEFISEQNSLTTFHGALTEDSTLMQLVAFKISSSRPLKKHIRLFNSTR